MTLQYKVTHVFCPLQLPNGDDHSHFNDLALSEAVRDSAFEFDRNLDHLAKTHWECTKKLLRNLCEAICFHQLEESCVASQLESMTAGDVVSYLIRAQNAAVVFRRGAEQTIAESFEVSPIAAAVMGSCGKLVCSYPGPAIAVPNVVFDDAVFRLELAHFLCEMDKDSLDAAPTTCKAGSMVSEERDTVHPRYITELLTGILRAVGKPADVQRINKRIGDDVVWHDARLPWRRSSLWLMIRVVLQTTLSGNDLGLDGGYKKFMLFFMNRLAGEALHARMSDDVLHWISAKISRRLTKLGDSAPIWLSAAVLETCATWKQVQEHDAFTPTWNPQSLNFQTDTQLSLLDSHEYISNILNPSGSTSRPAGFFGKLSVETGDFFRDTYKAYPRLTLYDVEREVSHSIDDWVAGALEDDADAACAKLELLASMYASAASETYKGNPEDFSRMFLTVIELWVAIDKLQLLLRDAHDISGFASHLITFASVTEAINGRSVFSDRADCSNFAVRYFQQDSHLQALRDRIVDARQDRREKVNELRRRVENRITVHEWPLPEDFYRVAVVFELNRPPAFDMWRSVICLLLIDICSPQLTGTSSYLSRRYFALGSYYTEHTRTRVTLASDTKPFIHSHYRSTYVPTDESTVCVNNGLNFYYYDKRSHVSVTDAFGTVDISGPCSHQLPRGPYQNLQDYLRYTAHTSNQLSIHEFIAYGHLRSGPSLQWLNILREIRANTLTLRRDEVHILFAQAVSQVGPISDDRKLVWHVELQHTHFRHSFLGELETLVSTVSGNWLEGTTMDTVSFVVARMLSARPAVQDHSYHRALELLRTVREKTFTWVLELFHKLEQTRRLRDSAAICRSTFDVGPDDITKLLDSTRALEILLCCAVVINNNTPPQFSARHEMSRLLMERDCRLSWKLEELVGTMILEGNDGIDLGIKHLWPGYRRGSQWQKAGTGNCSWFTTNTTSSEAQHSQQVHFDILNGTLLVDGRPMGRLPDEIRTDPIFTLLFGAQQAPDVLPGDLAGMDYVTRGLIDEYRVYFRMGSNGLIIQAQKEADPDVFELIPLQKLASDLPTALVENHVHWINLTTHTMEVRPIENLWGSSDNWTLHFSPGCHSMIKGDTTLLIKSPEHHYHARKFKGVCQLTALRSFFLVNDDWELECCNPRGMVYDESQSAGTLIGLANKLVLRPRPIYGSLASNLYRAYLHALTSKSCSVDPLTQRTGTEEALSILHSAACRSFMKIDTRCDKLLCHIAALTTPRTWYPKHLKCMQTVHWLAGLPAASQHHGFYLACSAVALYPPMSDNPFPGGGSDSVYEARDVRLSSADVLRAYSTALAVYNWSAQKPLLESWNATEPGIAPSFSTHISLSAMAYASSKLEDVVGTLLAFATMPQFKNENPPDYPSTTFLMVTHLRNREKPYNYSLSPEEYRERLQREKSEIIARTTAAWPCLNPPPCRNLFWYDTAALDRDLCELFASCYRNMELKNHLNHVESILGQKPSHPFIGPLDPTSLANRSLEYPFTPSLKGHNPIHRAMTLDDLFQRAALAVPPPPKLELNLTLSRSQTWYLSFYTMRMRHAESYFFSGPSQMSQLIDDLRRNANSAFQLMYADGLQRSADHLSHDQTTLEVDAPEIEHFVKLIRGHYKDSRKIYMSTLRSLVAYLGPQTTSERAVYSSGQWPRVTAKVLFGCLSSTSQIRLSRDWRVCLIAFTKLALEYQRTRRMLALAKNGRAEDLHKEIENTGCNGWDAESYADWLLIQLDGDFLIRPVQADVASEMIAPHSGQNTVLQLNMGEGKSSVIVPATASVLADGNQLVRVVVPKALASQMLHLLVHRLGGLANRRVFYLPFSRSLEIGHLVQPEHILSFKLLSVEKQLDDTTGIAEQLLQTQRWLHSYARDILDESDEILHVRNQLIYAIGLQRPLDGAPTRWSTVQQILHLVKKHAPSLHEFPLGDVMDGRLLNFNQTRRSERTAIHDFITRMDVAPSEVQMIRDYCGGTTMWMSLLHLRGLLASGILLFALTERRWRVGYGLAPPRTMLAVPYRAKDMPAPRAEFGHPDVAIVLTCLSYYYGGLDREQLTLCFERLFTLDNPDQEYESWVRDCLEVPEHLYQISGINTQSLDQWNSYLFPIFSYNQSTIDFYLSHVVFPKEAKEFPSKLSSCGWDLAEAREHITTGFSGTNDARYLLPTSTSQRDLDHQRSTNAKVLAYLLRPENDAYVQTSWADGRRRTAGEFLGLIAEQKPEIRVILDVGAQVLELQNNELVALWLELKPDALAAIYFNDNDELTVLSREGTKRSFAESPYASRLDECIVYLDDAHTRGTDIKFPIGFRAAATLGPKVTKDRLVQGCMRMRKLGHGHSIMFFGPLEVDRSIRKAARKNRRDRIHPADILLWAMDETCTEIQNSAPHWAQQGRDHASRYSAWSEFCSNEITCEELAAAWRQPDAKTLEELYAPSSPEPQPTLSFPAIEQRCQELGVSSSTHSNMNEEQEREIVHEIEREMQVERPPPANPAVHQVSADIRHFVRTGMVNPRSKDFIHMFDSFRDPTAPPQENTVWSRHIFATSDYSTVVQGPSQVGVGEYLRPVNWILSSQSSGNPPLVILSPFEVDGLLPDIRSSESARMRPCDDLRLYTINLFAGQLYLRDYNTYLRLCYFLCVYADDLHGEEDLEVESDGFIAPAHRPLKARSIDTFQKSPLAFLKYVTNLRRRGMNFTATHMGKILNGRSLKREDFEDQRKIEIVTPRERSIAPYDVITHTYTESLDFGRLTNGPQDTNRQLCCTYTERSPYLVQGPGTNTQVYRRNR
ncbi:hypothetical protein BKA82DRAFT_4493645 [Pisolithus tinctorius]|nr:hypothetical protein BKA82DRAFT_4493645 [Pisolithus tinctorius]